MPRIHEYRAVPIVSLIDMCAVLPALETDGWSVMGPITYLSYGALQGAILLRRAVEPVLATEVPQSGEQH